MTTGASDFCGPRLRYDDDAYHERGSTALPPGAPESVRGRHAPHRALLGFGCRGMEERRRLLGSASLSKERLATSLEPIGCVACKRVMSKLHWSAGCVVLIVLAGCSLVFGDPQTPSTTCAEWLSMPDRSKTDLATVMVDSEDILESVRKSQHREPDVSKALLVQDVVQSVTKNCEIMHEPNVLVVDITTRLYGGNRVYETVDPKAPTPETGS